MKNVMKKNVAKKNNVVKNNVVKKKMLVIDDSVLMRTLIGAFLKEFKAYDIELRFASNGLEALEALTKPSTVRLHTDSKYLRDGITQWIVRWKRNGWRTASKKPVKNVDLWQRLDDALPRHEVSWHWVRGHAGHPENERADELARRGLEQNRDAYPS